MIKSFKIKYILAFVLMVNFLTTLSANEKFEKNVIKIVNTAEVDRTNADVKIVLPNSFPTCVM